MPYYMAPVASTLADDSYYDTYADAQVGSNGNACGDPTTSIGDLWGEENWAYQTWDDSSTTGFDTGHIPIQLDVKSDGTEILTNGGGDTLTYQTGSIGAISSVVIEAAVQTNAETSWSDVSVEFLNQGTVVETDNFGTGPDANAIDSGSDNIKDQILTVTPTATNCDEAIVFGSLRMNSPGITTPGSTSMFANIFVNGTH